MLYDKLLKFDKWCGRIKYDAVASVTFGVLLIGGWDEASEFVFVIFGILFLSFFVLIPLEIPLEIFLFELTLSCWTAKFDKNL